jgi:hypothetical protein
MLTLINLSSILVRAMGEYLVVCMGLLVRWKAIGGKRLVDKKDNLREEENMKDHKGGRFFSIRYLLVEGQRD